MTLDASIFGGYRIRDPLRKVAGGLRHARAAVGRFVSRKRSALEISLVVASLIVALVLAVQVPINSNDLLIEWVVIHAVEDGIDPATPIRDLADTYGFEDHPIYAEAPAGAIDPGTPGALPFDLPLLLVSPDQLPQLSILLFLACTVAFAFVVARLYHRPFHQVALFIPVFMLTYPWRHHLAMGQWTLAVGALIGWTWLLARKGDRFAYGIPLGVAVALKLFPWLLVVVLGTTGRIRVAIGSAAAFVALNVAGLSLPGVRWETVANWVFEGGSVAAANAHNGSPLLAVGVPTWVLPVAAVVALVWFRRLDTDTAMTLAIPTCLIFSPLVWSHYVTILPMAVAGTWGLGLLIALGLLMLNPPLHALLGTVGVIGVLLLSRHRTIRRSWLPVVVDSASGGEETPADEQAFEPSPYYTGVTSDPRTEPCPPNQYSSEAPVSTTSRTSRSSFLETN